MSAGAEARWAPSLTALRRGATTWGDEGHAITWSFKQLTLPGVPLCYVECSIGGFGHETTGLGDGFTFKTAATRALAEAWERLWMLRESATTRPEIDSSNGFAAGRTVAHAQAAARGELVERATLLEAWRTRRGWAVHRAQSLMTAIFRGWLETKGWSLALFALRATDGCLVVAGLARHPELGAAFDTKYAAAGDLDAAERGLARSLARTVTVQALRAPPRGWSLPERAEPEDHQIFYRDPAHLEAFAFLSFDAARAPLPAIPSDDAVEVVTLCDASVLPAVALARHPAWAAPVWGRASIEGENPWPHPLA